MAVKMLETNDQSQVSFMKYLAKKLDKQPIQNNDPKQEPVSWSVVYPNTN